MDIFLNGSLGFRQLNYFSPKIKQAIINSGSLRVIVSCREVLIFEDKNLSFIKKNSKKKMSD